MHQIDVNITLLQAYELNSTRRRTGPPPPPHPRVYLRGLPSRFRTHNPRVFIRWNPALHHLHCDCTGLNVATTAAAIRKHLVSFHAWCGYSACLCPFPHRMPRAESQRFNAKVSRVYRFAGWVAFPLSQLHALTIYWTWTNNLISHNLRMHRKGGGLVISKVMLEVDAAALATAQSNLDT